MCSVYLWWRNKGFSSCSRLFPTSADFFTIQRFFQTLLRLTIKVIREKNWGKMRLKVIKWIFQKGALNWFMNFESPSIPSHNCGRSWQTAENRWTFIQLSVLKRVWIILLCYQIIQFFTRDNKWLEWIQKIIEFTFHPYFYSSFGSL